MLSKHSYPSTSPMLINSYMWKNEQMKWMSIYIWKVLSSFDFNKTIIDRSILFCWPFENKAELWFLFHECETALPLFVLISDDWYGPTHVFNTRTFTEGEFCNAASAVWISFFSTMRAFACESFNCRESSPEAKTLNSTRENCRKWCAQLGEVFKNIRWFQFGRPLKRISARLRDFFTRCAGYFSPHGHSQQTINKTSEARKNAGQNDAT